MNEIPASAYPQLIELIDETYTDKLDRILKATVDDGGNILCVAVDGNKRLAIEITDEGIEVKLIPDTAAFAAPANISPDLVDSYVKQLADADPFTPWLQEARS